MWFAFSANPELELLEESARLAEQEARLATYRRWPQPELDFDLKLGKDELRYWFRMFDPLHEREAEVFTRLGYIDNQHLAPRIRAEVKMATGLMDTICPPSTQFAAYNRLRCPKSMVLYPDFGHEGLPYVNDHAMAFLAGL